MTDGTRLRRMDVSVWPAPEIGSVMQARGWKTAAMVSRYTERLSARRGAVARFYAR